jgi:hypothetical protein
VITTPHNSYFAAYAGVSNTDWVNPGIPGCGPPIVATSNKYIIAEARHQFEDEHSTCKTYNNAGQVFDPIYLGIINDDMVGFANTMS